MSEQLTTLIEHQIENQTRLDPLSETLQEVVQSTYQSAGPEGKAVKNFLHGVWLGHPLHPVLVNLPLGGWTIALVFDALEILTGKRHLGKCADATILLGLVGAAGSAATGLTDWQHLAGKPRRVGLVHGLLNTVATTLHATSWILRQFGQRSLARGVSALGYAGVMLSAYLGGVLVYTHRIGVNHTQVNEDKLKDFVPVLALDDLPEGEMRRVEVEGTPVLLARRNSYIYALAETCAHLGGPLAEGKLEGNTVVCPWHQSRFQLEDGRVLDGPATNPQPCFDVRVRQNRIEIRAAQGRPTFSQVPLPAPAFPAQREETHERPNLA